MFLNVRSYALGRCARLCVCVVEDFATLGVILLASRHCGQPHLCGSVVWDELAFCLGPKSTNSRSGLPSVFDSLLVRGCLTELNFIGGC